MSSPSESFVRKPPIGERPPEFDPDSGPALNSETIDDFLMWAANVPVGFVDAIRTRIQAARNDESLLESLLQELWRLPVDDPGRHGLLLSTIGELHDRRAASALVDFIWLPEDQISPVEYEQDDGGCGFGAGTARILKSRAVEMLSYLGTEEAVNATLRIAEEHPAASVRAAAIDAHLYNHDDSPEEIDRLRGRVRAGDARLVGLPRFTRDMSQADFDRALEEFYTRHPEHLAPSQLDPPVPPAPRNEG